MIQLRIKQFFFENKDFFATKTDKGGHVVILNLQQYRDRIEKLLNDDSYQLVSSNPLKSLVETETNFVKKLEKNTVIVFVRAYHCMSRIRSSCQNFMVW